MAWVKRKQDIHVCKKPPFDRRINEGDVWACDDCGERWVVTKVRSGFDPRPGEGEYGWFDWDKERYSD